MDNGNNLCKITKYGLELSCTIDDYIK